MTIFEGDVMSPLLGGLLIAAARICDVTLGTLRISFISKGQKGIAPLVGFFEMLIWLFAISRIAQNLDNITYYFFYAGGFACGVLVGLIVEERLALGLRVIRTITRKNADELVAKLRQAGWGVTSVEANGAEGPVNLIFSIAQRIDIPRYIEIVKEFNPHAFYSVEDIRFVSEGVFPPRQMLFGRRPRWRRKTE
jgi:uncharacterized protein YebE (UPF0316 family)